MFILFLDLTGKWRNDLPCSTPLGVLCQGGTLANPVFLTTQGTTTGNITTLRYWDVFRLYYITLKHVLVANLTTSTN